MNSKLIQYTILLLLLAYLPSIRCTTTSYFYPIHLTILYIIAFLLIKLIPSKISIPILTIGILYYRHNISLIFGFIYNIITLQKNQKTLNTYENNDHIKNIIYRMYNKSLNLKLYLNSLQNLQKPCIIVCNYCTDRLENLACMLLPGDFAIMMRDGLKPFFGNIVKWKIYTEAKGSFDTVTKDIKSHTDAGRSILTYGTIFQNLGHNYVKRVRTGVFSIAKKLNLPIVLVCIDTIQPGRFGVINYQPFYMKSSEPITVSDNINLDVRNARLWFIQTLKTFQKQAL
jgi:hypothetical protein